MAKLSVSKTELGGSNPSAPARYSEVALWRTGANRATQVLRRQWKPPQDDKLRRAHPLRKRGGEGWGTREQSVVEARGAGKR
jgi:hypothetical protein